MLLQSYQLEVVNNHCMPGAQSINCIARLDQDMGCAIPYTDNFRKCVRSQISSDANPSSLNLYQLFAMLGQNLDAGKVVTICDHLHGTRGKIWQSRMHW